MDVRREVLLDAGTDEVWHLLTDDGELSCWLGDEVRLDLRPGGTGVVRDGEGVRHAVVEEVTAGRRLVLSWWPEGGEEAATRVSFELAGDGDRTRLTVVEAAPARRREGAGGAWCRRDRAWDERLFDLELRLVVRAGTALARR